MTMVMTRARADSEGRGRRAVTRGRGARGTTTTLRAGSPKVDKTTGFIESDNTGMGNIFAIEPRQLYTESPTSDKFARQGLGGIGGAAVALAVVGAVARDDGFGWVRGDEQRVRQLQRTERDESRGRIRILGGARAAVGRTYPPKTNHL